MFRSRAEEGPSSFETPVIESEPPLTSAPPIRLITRLALAEIWEDYKAERVRRKTDKLAQRIAGHGDSIGRFWHESKDRVTTVWIDGDNLKEDIKIVLTKKADKDFSIGFGVGEDECRQFCFNEFHFSDRSLVGASTQLRGEGGASPVPMTSAQIYDNLQMLDRYLQDHQLRERLSYFPEANE